MSVMKKNIHVLTLAIILFGCDAGVNKKSSTTDDLTNTTNTTDTGTDTPVNTHCFAPGVGTNTDNYHTFSIVGKGWENPNSIGWASIDYPRNHGYNATETTYFNNRFKTDGRFNIRVIARPSVGKTVDEYGNSCSHMYRNYSKLQLKVRVRAPSSAFFQDHLFDNIPVDGCSEVHEYKDISTDEALNIQIMAVNWDYDCIVYTSRGFPDHPNACPWRFVNELSCYQLELQLSTSNTKDIPH